MAQDLTSGNPPRWTIGELIQWTEGKFREIGIETPRLDAELLLAEALGKTRLDLYLAYHRPVDAHEREVFRGYVLRRSRREPVAYIVGRREFYSLSFEVTPAVLIPRPETEHLVEVVLEELRLREGAGRVLDVGTGSGNIAVSVAVNAPDSRVDAMDSSAGALEVARRNAKRHGVESRIRFIQATRVSALRPEDVGYRVVAANPPYVSAAEAETLMPDVRLHEPREALVDEIDRCHDGLGHYRVLAREGAGLLEAGGLLAVEMGAGMLPMVVAEFESSGWRVDRVVPDLSGIDRVLALRVCGR